MSNLIEETQLLRQNKRDIVEALNQIGFPVTFETPLSKIAYYLKWASGFAGCPIATIEHSTGRQVFFPVDEWNNMSSNQRGNYDAIGVALHADGRSLIIAKENALSPTGTATMAWSAEQYANPELKAYSYSTPTTGILSDFDGAGKTDIICEAARVRNKAYPAAQQARAYKAFAGDPTIWHLGDVSEWSLVDKYYAEINTSMQALFGVSLPKSSYWTSDESTAEYKWFLESPSWGLNNYYYGNGLAVRPFAVGSLAI